MKVERAFNYDELRFTQQGGIEVAEMPVIGRVNRVRSDVLAKLEKVSRITPDQMTAGDLFQRDYQIAGMDMLQAAPLAPTIPGASHDKDEVKARAAKRWRGAVRHLGTVGASLAIWVCCENRTPTDWAHMRKVRIEYATERLKEALDELVSFYGVA